MSRCRSEGAGLSAVHLSRLLQCSLCSDVGIDRRSTAAPPAGEQVHQYRMRAGMSTGRAACIQALSAISGRTTPVSGGACRGSNWPRGAVPGKLYVEPVTDVDHQRDLCADHRRASENVACRNVASSDMTQTLENQQNGNMSARRYSEHVTRVTHHRDRALSVDHVSQEFTGGRNGLCCTCMSLFQNLSAPFSLHQLNDPGTFAQAKYVRGFV